jgi:glutaminyl-peptide cyclotransferase
MPCSFLAIKLREAMRIAWVAGLAVFMGACGGPAGDGRGPLEFDGANALGAAREQVDMGPRHPGSEGHTEVQGWIRDRLDAVGWEVAAQPFEYRGIPLRNLVASHPDLSGPLVILGAHYDTRPVADRDAARPDAPVPGANDGASGVAVLVELARVLPTDGLACEIRLAFFDAEDSGRIAGWDWALGSRHMAATLEEEPQAVVVVDMVGDRDLRLPREGNSNPALADAIWSAARTAGLTAFVDEDGPSLLDDHTPFLERGWPAVDIIDFSYPYWHTTEDTIDKLSAESLGQVGRAIQLWLQESCREDSPPADSVEAP